MDNCLERPGVAAQLLAQEVLWVACAVWGYAPAAADPVEFEPDPIDRNAARASRAQHDCHIAPRFKPDKPALRLRVAIRVAIRHTFHDRRNR